MVRREEGKLNPTQSCGRTGSCFHNAPAESFWALLREEIGTRTWPDRATARSEVFAFIETYYNRRRLCKHTVFGYLGRRRSAAARQPQRLQGMGTVRRQGRRRQDHRHRGRGYRGTGLVIPHRRERGQAELPAWKEEHNTSHRKVRGRVEHASARMKSWKILRDCRLEGDGVHHAMLGIARLYNLPLAG